MRRMFLAGIMLLFSAPMLYPQSPPDSSQSTQAETHHPVSFGSDGLLISTVDKSSQLRIHGYVQADDRYFSSNVNGEALDIFFFRKIRPLIEGTLFNAVDFRFMPDFGQNNPQIQEVYLELKSIPFARLRIGKFKEPMGLEVLRSDRELTFTERSLASDLVPLRYMGAQIGGSASSNTINYAAGYFNGSSDGSNGNLVWLQDNEFVVRLFAQPFASNSMRAVKQLGIGAAASEGDQHGSISALKTVGQDTFFKYSSGTVANGQHNRISPQAYYYFGPLGLLSEYVISSQEVLDKSTARQLRNEAWQVAASVVLTGEQNGYEGIRPRYPFEPGKGIRHLGALEFAVRYSHLAVDPNAFPVFASPKTAAQQAAEHAIGVTWYLNQYAKLLADYESTRFKMTATNVAPLHGENLLTTRIQLAF